MATQKLYAGAKLRETRTRIGLTQKAFAEKLGVSLPYLNQMENNNRPVSTGVVLALAQEFGFDVTELSTGDAERTVTDMREALADPVFADTAPPLADLRLAASNAPALARAFLELHRAYRQSHERLASLDEALGREDSTIRPSPWEEVRDFFHYCDNYIDAVDRAAEHFTCPSGTPTDPEEAARRVLGKLGVDSVVAEHDALRSYDPARKRLTLSRSAASATQRFQLLHQVALLTQDDLLNATLDLARFQTPEARAIAKIGLANYFAGAALMPYRIFQQAAEDTRHDVERLAEIFGASATPRCQRNSVLFRPRRSGGHHYQAPFRRAAAIRPVRRRLPAVERASGVRDAGPVPTATRRDPRWCALRLSGAGCVKARWIISRPRAAVCHRTWMRGAACPAVGLRRRHEPDKAARVRADRDILPHLRTKILPPTLCPAAGKPSDGGSRPARGAALFD